MRSSGAHGDAPTPTLAGIDQLVEDVRAGRLAVQVDVSGHRRLLPAAIETAAYRIVQESLTNVVRHAHAGVAW